LAGILKSNLNGFLDDFWRIGSIEDVGEYEREFELMTSKWPQAESYLEFLRSKEEKWAFAYTHRNFVAGVASTQRQEQVNSQINSNLISNSSMIRIIDGFESVEKSTELRRRQGNLMTKLTSVTNDPIISDPLRSLTSYAGSILKEECELSLSYTCVAIEAGNNRYKVSHKDNPEKFRVVDFASEIPLEAYCSCRKKIWHGIVCRHIICTMRHCNQLSCPVGLFNQRWLRDYMETSRASVLANVAFSFRGQKSNLPDSMTSEDQRISELSAVCKSLTLLSISEQSTYDMVLASVKSLQETVIRYRSLRQSGPDEDDAPIRNPLQVRTKGRPKTGGKRYRSQAEKQRSKRVRAKNSN
jgi:hypothetical protein